ncbi:hypothetical protein NECAME_09495 [Necator americanus]|uniref:Uncharacterized protein n=1 Tax=Necator americanus TaxID=51031 RepID=W2TEB1_NECAM|nr:hypothetical protein NECAME_09495 [Necator americanus]ETN79924.1 hypothetical protein NECAME_09495 [Necator americanus]
MQCGGQVAALTSIAGAARCMPDTNEIVVINENDIMRAEFCLRFQNRSPTIRKILEMWPGFYLQPTVYHPRRMYRGSNMLTFGGTMQRGLKEPPYKEIQCNAEFQNRSPTIRKILEMWPGFYLQPSVYHPRRMYRGSNMLTFGGIMQRGLKEPPYKEIQCNAECDIGQLFFYRLSPNQMFYSKIFVDGALCEWLANRGSFFMSKNDEL